MLCAHRGISVILYLALFIQISEGALMTGIDHRFGKMVHDPCRELHLPRINSRAVSNLRLRVTEGK